MDALLRRNIRRFLQTTKSPGPFAVLRGSWLHQPEVEWILFPQTHLMHVDQDFCSDDIQAPFEGCLGLLSYSDTRKRHFVQAAQNSAIALSASSLITVFSAKLLLDKQGQVLEGSSCELALKWQKLLENAEHQAEPPIFKCGNFHSVWHYKEYAAAFAKVIAYIKAGDVYQVNLAQPFRATFQGDPLAAFLSADAQILAPFSAYIEAGDWQLLSFSPEKFLQISGSQVVSQPIKGTRPRGKTPIQDLSLRQELKESEKDRAENLMIVDLIRNDLGRISAIGSVKVPRLFKLESFSNVHHMISTITSNKRTDVTAIQAMIECMPGGSITGAPKKRAMEIIEELEVEDRAAYCGSVFLKLQDRLYSNITIRTATIQNGSMSLWGGGGIVADSDCAAEYRESIIKVDHIVKALGGPSLLDSLMVQSDTI